MYVFVYIKEPISLHIRLSMRRGALPIPFRLYYMYILYVHLEGFREVFFATASKSGVDQNPPRSLRELGDSLVFRASPNQLAVNFFSFGIIRGGEWGSSLTSFVSGRFERIFGKMGSKCMYTPPSVWFPHLLQISRFKGNTLQKKK